MFSILIALSWMNDASAIWAYVVYGTRNLGVIIHIQLCLLRTIVFLIIWRANANSCSIFVEKFIRPFFIFFHLNVDIPYYLTAFLYIRWSSTPKPVNKPHLTQYEYSNASNRRPPKIHPSSTISRANSQVLLISIDCELWIIMHANKLMRTIISITTRSQYNYSPWTRVMTIKFVVKSAFPFGIEWVFQRRLNVPYAYYRLTTHHSKQSYATQQHRVLSCGWQWARLHIRSMDGCFCLCDFQFSNIYYP